MVPMKLACIVISAVLSPAEELVLNRREISVSELMASMIVA
jgi:hypothetical protein